MGAKSWQSHNVNLIIVVFLEVSQLDKRGTGKRSLILYQIDQCDAGCLQNLFCVSPLWGRVTCGAVHT
jgi:hypothetical protein